MAENRPDSIDPSKDIYRSVDCSARHWTLLFFGYAGHCGQFTFRIGTKNSRITFNFDDLRMFGHASHAS